MGQGSTSSQADDDEDMLGEDEDNEGLSALMRAQMKEEKRKKGSLWYHPGITN